MDRSTTRGNAASDDEAHPTHLISRVVVVLRHVARRTDGIRLVELTAATGLPHSTAHRLVKTLVAERLINLNPRTHRYQLGRLTYELGLAAATKPDYPPHILPCLERLAADTGDTTYLIARSGADAVCLLRIEGSYPIKALTTEVGGRRPLFVGAAGIALLARLSDDEIDEVLTIGEQELKVHKRISEKSVRDAVKRTRERGYALLRDVAIAGASSIGLVLPPPGNRPELAISVAMTSNRLNAARAQRIYDMMLREIMAPAFAQSTE